MIRPTSGRERSSPTRSRFTRSRLPLRMAFPWTRFRQRTRPSLNGCSNWGHRCDLPVEGCWFRISAPGQPDRKRPGHLAASHQQGATAHHSLLECLSQAIRMRVSRCSLCALPAVRCGEHQGQICGTKPTLGTKLKMSNFDTIATCCNSPAPEGGRRQFFLSGPRNSAVQRSVRTQPTNGVARGCLGPFGVSA